MDKISLIKNILNWDVIETSIWKIFKVKLPESIKEEGLKELYHKYKDKLLEMEVVEIEKELLSIYLKKLRNDPKLIRKLRNELAKTDDDEEFMQQIEEAARAFPELEYMARMMKIYPDFKEFMKKKQKEREKQLKESQIYIEEDEDYDDYLDENDDEDLDDYSDDPSDYMFL
ncbi:MAG: hypothetical protein ACTSO2_05795 [Promethearchaeota archaeon]